MKTTLVAGRAAAHGSNQWRRMHFLAVALLLLTGLAWSPSSKAYTPCSGAGTVGGAGNVAPGGTFSSGNAQGAICDYPTLDSSGTPADEYWLEIDNEGTQTLLCDATLWIVDSGGGESSLSGSAYVFPGDTTRIVDTDPVTNTGGVDAPKTIHTVQCSVSSGGGGGASGGGGSGSSPVQLSGSIFYSVTGGDVTLKVNEILNSSSTYTTASLRLELWLTTAPYSGGNISGYRVATDPITGNTNGSLGPGQYFPPINATVPLTNLPGAGSYYATLIVSEYTENCGTADGYCIDTWGSFPNQYAVGGGGNTGGSENIVIGSSSYTANLSTNALTFSVASIANTSSSYATGTLRLEWWLTANPYGGSSIPGNRIAAWTIQNSTNGQLGPGQWFQNLSGSTSISNLPAPGTYYVTLIVSEYRENCGSSDGYCVDAYSNSSSEMTIPSQSPATGSGNDSNRGTSSGGGSGSGGGGAIDWATLAGLGLLAGIRSFRRRSTWQGQ